MRANVAAGSAAEEAGIQKGDIIVSAGRIPVSAAAKLAQIAGDQENGKPLLMQIRSGDSSLFVAVG